MDDLTNVTFLRFDYPYYTRYKGEIFIRDFNKDYLDLQGKFLSRILLKIPIKIETKTFIQPFSIDDINSVQITKVKFNKIAGTIYTQRLFDGIQADMLNPNAPDYQTYFQGADPMKVFQDLFAKKINNIDNNIYMNIYLRKEDRDPRNNVISSFSHLMINLSKRSLRQVL